AEQVSISCVDYCPEQVSFQEINDLEAFVEQHRPDWTVVRWISVDGLDSHAIQVLATKYDLHPLAVEDMLQGKQRAKVEQYGGQRTEFTATVCIVARALRIR